MQAEAKRLTELTQAQKDPSCLCARKGALPEQVRGCGAAPGLGHDCCRSRGPGPNAVWVWGGPHGPRTVEPVQTVEPVWTTHIFSFPDLVAEHPRHYPTYRTDWINPKRWGGVSNVPPFWKDVAADRSGSGTWAT